MRGRWLALTAWLVVVLLNSSVASSSLDAAAPISTLLSKAGHVVEYGVLGYLLWIATAEAVGNIGLCPAGWPLAVIAAGTLFAVLDELRQLFVAGRFASVTDIALDVAALGAVVLIQQRRTLKQTPDHQSDLN